MSSTPAPSTDAAGEDAVSPEPKRDQNTTTTQQIRYEYTIRTATEADLQYLPAVENSAGTLFRTIPELAYLADDEDTSAEQHRVYLEEAKNVGFDGGVMIAVPEAVSSSSSFSSSSTQQELDGVLGKPVAFVATSCYRCNGVLGVVQSQVPVEPYFLHIHELAVHADHQRRGLAGRLLKAVWESAGRFNSTEYKNSDGGLAKCITTITLTTFRDVAFNGMFYGKLGWREIPAQNIEGSVGKQGVKIWNEEQTRFAAEGLAERRCWMMRNLGPWP